MTGSAESVSDSVTGSAETHHDIFVSVRLNVTGSAESVSDSVTGSAESVSDSA